MDSFGRTLLAGRMLLQPVENVAAALILAEAGCALCTNLERLPPEPQAPRAPGRAARETNMTAETIARLEQERGHHEREMRKREDAIRALRACCAHEWEPDGHDSHHDYRKCRVCGLRECCR